MFNITNLSTVKLKTILCRKNLKSHLQIKNSYILLALLYLMMLKNNIRPVLEYRILGKDNNIIFLVKIDFLVGVESVGLPRAVSYATRGK